MLPFDRMKRKVGFFDVKASDVLFELDIAVNCTQKVFDKIEGEHGDDYARGCLDALMGFRKYVRSEMFRNRVIDRRKEKNSAH
jgi:hypothetical protein